MRIRRIPNAMTGNLNKLGKPRRKVPFRVGAAQLLREVIGLLILFFGCVFIMMMMLPIDKPFYLAPLFLVKKAAVTTGVITDVLPHYAQSDDATQSYTQKITDIEYKYSYNVGTTELHGVTYGPPDSRFKRHDTVQVQYVLYHQTVVPHVRFLDDLSASSRTFTTAFWTFFGLMLAIVFFYTVKSVEKMALLRDGTFAWGELKSASIQTEGVKTTYAFVTHDGTPYSVTQEYEFKATSIAGEYKDPEVVVNAAILYDPEHPSDALILPQQQHHLVDKMDYLTVDRDGKFQPAGHAGLLEIAVLAAVILPVLVRLAWCYWYVWSTL